MAASSKLTPRGMVLYVLSMATGEALSVKQIREKVQEKFFRQLHEQTIVAAIDESDFVTGNIEEAVERRGKLKLPTRVFSVTLKNIEN